jgi:hypothetical protein
VPKYRISSNYQKNWMTQLQLLPFFTDDKMAAQSGQGHIAAKGRSQDSNLLSPGPALKL